MDSLEEETQETAGVADEERIHAIAQAVLEVTRQYITGLYGISSDRALHLGSGSFILIDGIVYLLTAMHVADAAKEFNHVVYAGREDGEPYRLPQDPWRVSNPEKINDGQHGPLKNWAADLAIAELYKSPLEGTKHRAADWHSLIAKKPDVGEEDLLFLHGFPLLTPEQRETLIEHARVKGVGVGENFANIVPSRAVLYPTSLLLPKPEDKDDRTGEFAVRFRQTGGVTLSGEVFTDTLTNNGFSGSVVWRLKGSWRDYISLDNLGPEHLEIVGLVKQGNSAREFLWVTDVEQLWQMIEKMLGDIGIKAD